jgi:hypothetical protein
LRREVELWFDHERAVGSGANLNEDPCYQKVKYFVLEDRETATKTLYEFTNIHLAAPSDE